MREEPLSPPSVLANNDTNKIGILDGIGYLLKNRNYILLFFTFTLMYGNYSAMGAILSTITAPYKYTVTENSMLALMFLLGGIFNSFFLGSIVDKHQCYKKIVTGLCFAAAIFMSLTFGTLKVPNHIVFCVNMIVVGASVIPITSISYAFSAELAYPVPDSLANG